MHAMRPQHSTGTGTGRRRRVLDTLRRLHGIGLAAKLPRRRGRKRPQPDSAHAQQDEDSCQRAGASGTAACITQEGQTERPPPNACVLRQIYRHPEAVRALEQAQTLPSQAAGRHSTGAAAGGGTDKDKDRDSQVQELIEQWLFPDSVSDLQVIDVVSLSEPAKAALFLNLYHVMVIHGSLVLFPPQTSANWQPFFNDVAYLVSFDVLSMAELEHNVLKATMTKPPRLALGLGRNSSAPKSQFPGFALKNRDFRLIFCLCNGSISTPGKICIYMPDTLDAQLDAMTSVMLCETLNIDEFKRVVTLPIAAGTA